MALVVFVFAAILMLAEGLEQTLVDSGSYENAVVIRKSANSEVQSGVGRREASVVETQPEIAYDAAGRRLVAKELVVLINLRKRGSESTSNVTIRGISAASLALRPQVRLTAGRLPRPGSSEVAVGASIAQRFQDADFPGTLSFAADTWRVVGVFDAGNTGFSSEIWGDVDQLMQAFRRPAFSSVIFRLKDPAALAAVKTRIESDPRLPLEVKREVTYYRDQSEVMAKFLRILGTTLTIIFSIGAVVGAMITMYAAVAHRTAEIGTLRAVGFRALGDPDRLPGGIPRPGASGRHRGRGPGRRPPVFHRLHHQLPDLRRDGLQVPPERRSGAPGARLRRRHGACRRPPARLPRRAHEHRRGAAGGLARTFRHLADASGSARLGEGRSAF